MNRKQKTLRAFRGIAFGVALLSSLGYAQQVNVSATVVDPFGRAYANGTFQGVWVNQSGISQLPLLNGSTFQTTVVGAMNSAGQFTTVVADNNQITPAPSQWQWTICSQRISGQQSVCFTVLITMTGASQNIGATLSASAIALPSTGTNQMTNGDLFGTTVNHGLLSGAAGSSILSPNIEKVRFADQFSTLALAISSACNGTAPGWVILPAGVTMSAAIAIPSNCKLTGFGGLLGSTLKANVGVDADFVTASSASNIELSNLAIDGNDANETSGSCVALTSVTGVRIENATIQNCYTHGIGVFGTSSNVLIAHNVIAIAVHGSCIILGNTPPNAQVQYFSIIDNDVSGSGVADGIFVIGSLSSGTFGTGYGVISHNRVHGNADTGIEVGQATHDIAVTGNQVQPGNTAGSTGIMVRSAKNVQVTGSVVTGTGAATQDCYFTWNGGGDATSISNVNFTGNTAEGCGRYGFNLNAGDDILLAGNKSQGNTTGQYNIGAATNVREYGNDNDLLTSPAPLVFDATNGDPQISANANAGLWDRSTGTACGVGGLWRLVNSGGSLLLNQNTSSLCDFSTNTSALTFTPTTLAAAFGGAVSAPSVSINGGTALTGQTGTGGTLVTSAGPTLTGKTTVAVLANGCSGTSAAMVAGAVTVSNACVTTGVIALTLGTSGGTPGFLRVSSQTAGTGFTITSTSGTDTSTVNWVQN